MIKNLLFRIIGLVDRMVPKNPKKILFYSFPDCSDNVFAFYCHMYEKNKRSKKKYKLVWLVDNLDKIETYKKIFNNYVSSHHLLFVKKKSFEGLYHYFTSRYVFISHNLYRGVQISTNHIIVNLWHGMPIKRIGVFDNKKILQHQTYFTVTSSFYADIIRRAFNMKKKGDVIITGQARNDLFNILKPHKNFDFIEKNNGYKKIFLWLPTYRASDKGEIRQDSQATLPLISHNHISEFNELLSMLNCLCIIKIHPMDKMSKNDLMHLSHIKVIDNEDLEKEGIQLNSLLAHADALITDYSSVFIDFMLLERPIVFLMDDLEEYKNSRGFLMDDLEDFLPCEITDSYEKLEQKIIQIANDTYTVKYRHPHLFNEVKQDFCEKIYQEVILKHG